MKNLTSSPAISFFEVYKDNILSCREDLFKELHEVSPEFGKEARKILETKLKFEKNPPMGELFPWLITDLTDSDIIVTKRISIGWLAIYLYTLFLDEYVDNPKFINPTKFITGSLLAKTGLLKIAKFTFNTPFEDLVENALTYSATNQQLDVQFQKDKIDLEVKKKYSEGKNYVILACAGALAAQNSKCSDFIIQFTKKLLLTFQYLDDLSDYFSDFKRKNYTVLLNDAFINTDFSNSTEFYTKEAVLSQLVLSGALQRIIKKICQLLDQALILAKENSLIESTNNKSSMRFFYEVESECKKLDAYLTCQQSIYEHLTKYQKSLILDKISKHLIIIADGT